MKSTIRFIWLVMLTLVAAVPAALATTTWYVNGVSGSNSHNCTSPITACKTIKHAISLASSGDTIMVAAAIYAENLTISISLKVIGSGAATTIVDGGGVNTVVTISSATAHVTISKLTIRNGSSVSGGGIYNSGTVTLNLSAVIGNVAHHWGGGMWNGGTLTINNSTISRNSATVICTTQTVCVTNGGGIFNSAGTLAINQQHHQREYRLCQLF